MTTTPTRMPVDLVTAEPGTRRDADGAEILGVALIRAGRRTVHMDLHAALRLARQLTDAVNTVITVRSPEELRGGGKTPSTSNHSGPAPIDRENHHHGATATARGVGESKSSDQTPG